MRKGAGMLLAMIVAASLGGPALAALVLKKTPYYGSISAGKARMRTGPARTYPANWLYQRADLPVKVLAVYEHGAWMKVEDPGGTQGWIMGNLVSETRTALVVGAANAELREAPRLAARLTWRVAPGVVGRLSKCGQGWCHLDVRGRGGFIETAQLWGVDPAEQF